MPNLEVLSRLRDKALTRDRLPIFSINPRLAWTFFRHKPQWRSYPTFFLREFVDRDAPFLGFKTPCVRRARVIVPVHVLDLMFKAIPSSRSLSLDMERCTVQLLEKFSFRQFCVDFPFSSYGSLAHRWCATAAVRKWYPLETTEYCVAQTMP